MKKKEMDTLELMIEIKKRQGNKGVEISIHPKGFGCVVFGTDEHFFTHSVRDIKTILQRRLKKLNNRGLLFKKF